MQTVTLGTGDRTPRWSRPSLALAAAAAMAVAIGSQSRIGQLDRIGQSALAVMGMTVILWVADVLNPGITALLALGLLIVVGVPSNVALSGFATGAFWILVSVLFFGTAMDKTGLARRISYRILITFRPTYSGILFAFMLIGFALALGVPSMTVRTAIMVPIAFALVRAIGLQLPGDGAALIVLTTFEMAVLPGCAVLTGSLWGPFIAGLFANAGLPLTWFGYARVMTLPTIVWCVLLVAVNRLLIRPPGTNIASDVVRTEMHRLGRMRREEIATAIVIGAAILTWATQPWHRVPAEAVGMIALVLLFATGVLVPGEIGTGIPWALAIFVGSMLSLTTVMSNYHINTWIGGYIVPTVQPFVHRPYLLVIALSLSVAAMRFVDPVGFITIATFVLPLARFMADRGVPPLVLTAVVLLPVHVFWFNYQNIWILMTEGLTSRSAYTSAHRLKLATAFFGVTVVALWIGVTYWRLIGAL
jgi:DASS family divalent anion:Na+ symporter